MKKSIVILALTAATVVAVLTVHAQQGATALSRLEGIKPYIPTRIEWLAVELNAYYRTDMGDNGYMLTFVPIEKENTILLYVRYMRTANREAMNLSVDTARKVLNINVKSKGWEDWVKVREKIKMAN